MTTLHIVHRLDGGHLPGSLARSLVSGDTLLLTGEGVYAAIADAGALPPDCVALEADVRARGLMPQWPADLPLIDHGGFVELVVRHDKSLSWG